MLGTCSSELLAVERAGQNWRQRREGAPVALGKATVYPVQCSLLDAQRMWRGGKKTQVAWKG